MNRRKPYNKGQWAVARERLHIADFEPPAADPGAPPLAAIIPDVLKGMKLDVHAQVAQIAADWPEIVGPQLAANIKPAHLENKVLAIYVSHPAWIFELRGRPAAEILARLQARYGKPVIQNIRFAVDPDPPARRP
jgi:predicted nucleic acid-binding Zn ribbon protein